MTLLELAKQNPQLASDFMAPVHEWAERHIDLSSSWNEGAHVRFTPNDEAWNTRVEAFWTFHFPEQEPDFIDIEWSEVKVEPKRLPQS